MSRDQANRLIPFFLVHFQLRRDPKSCLAFVFNLSDSPKGEVNCNFISPLLATYPKSYQEHTPVESIFLKYFPIIIYVVSVLLYTENTQILHRNYTETPTLVLRCTGDERMISRLTGMEKLIANRIKKTGGWGYKNKRTVSHSAYIHFSGSLP